MSLRAAALAGAILVPALGCQRQRPEPSPMNCRPAAASSSVRMSAEHLAGTYQLRMVATEGPQTGQAADGTLRLQPYDQALREVTVGGIRDTAARYVQYGSTDVNPDAVGAVGPGDLGSRDPLRPGVVVIERKGSITLRMGADANRRGVVRFDGGYLALRVADSEDDRFTGSWTSGVGTQRSAGYFCAARLGEKK